MSAAMSRNVPASFAAKDDDKHYKMCKKIAQLTKVIYTLNNRCEDNDQRTEWLHQTHMQERAQLCQEYESHLEKLQQQIRGLQADKINIAASLERSQKEQLQAAQEEFKTRLAALSEQVSEQESRFDSTLLEEKQRMAAELAAETKRARESKDLELANLVREYNDKYKAMLAEQLDSRDALEEKLKREWGSKVDALQTELAAAQGSASAQLQSKSRLLQEALQRCATLANERDLSAASRDEAHTHLQTLQGQLGRAEEELAGERRQRAASDELKKELEARLVSLERKRNALQRECAEAQQSLAAEKALNARQAAAVQALENEKASLSTSTETLTQELEGCKASLTASTAQRDAAEAQLRDLQSSSVTHASLLSDTRSQLDEAKQRLATALHQVAEAARMSQAKHEEELRNARASLESNSSSEQQRLMEAHKEESDALKRTHEAEMLRLETEMQRLHTERAATQESLQRTAKDAEVAAATIAALTAQCEEHDALLRSRAEESAAERLQLEQQLLQLQREVEAARNDGAEGAAAQVAALERAQAEHAAVCAAEEAAHAKALREAGEKSAAQLESVSRNNAALVNAMQKQHSAAMERAKEDAAVQAASISRNVETQLAALRRDYDERLAAVRTAAAATEGKLHTLISELQAQLRQALSETAALQTSNSDTLEQRQAEIALLKAAMEKAQTEAAAVLNRTRSDADAQRRDEVHALEVARQRQVAAERQRYEAAVAAGKEQMAKMEARFDERIEAAKAHLQETVAALKAARIKGMQELEEQLNVAHQLRVRELTATHDAERGQLQDTIGTMDVTLKELISSMASKEEKLARLLAQRDQLLEEVTTAKRNGAAAVVAEQNRRAADLEQLRVEHQRELKALGDTHKEIVDDFVRQQAEERRAHQGLVDELRSTVEELQYKYHYRESRPEDVELINKLLQDSKEKELALSKAYEDMRLYKLELINREENYNKVFGRHPNVADYSAIAQVAGKRPSSLPRIGATRQHSTR